MSRGEVWSGKSCCKLARAPLSRHACNTDFSNDDLRTLCRQNGKQTLFHCVERHALGFPCCDKALLSST